MAALNVPAGMRDLLAAYAGLAPVTRQSGTSLAAETRSRRGSHRLQPYHPARRTAVLADAA